MSNEKNNTQREELWSLHKVTLECLKAKLSDPKTAKASDINSAITFLKLNGIVLADEEQCYPEVETEGLDYLDDFDLPFSTDNVA